MDIIIARRLTIITLTFMIFALTFSALVAHPGRHGSYQLGGLAGGCEAMMSCHVSL
ncbi:hypothetical protein [Neorhizobium alkalisoli]|jgi:hypothetical protein|uniref:Uncharacterized protein n=1 Tax=Neorhizobium alkalisoli TaxID=528178 RepID=A0A561R2U5_9HYPH|nr:hypothetical protein [Neorhizobium alkalisoli]TWF56938.1 hypothetical protein FHW37_102578 [Neorhizobium alkalisoli]